MISAAAKHRTPPDLRQPSGERTAKPVPESIMDQDLPNASGVTTGDFFQGKIKIRQRRNGYRFSIDSVILAWEAGLRDAQTIVDLGTGCGIIPIILAHRNPRLTVAGIEIQDPLADLAEQNVRLNGLEANIDIIRMDLKQATQKTVSGRVDMAVANPPYRKAGSGRINPDSEKAVARHELAATLADITAAAHRLIRRFGRFLIIYPAERAADLICMMRNTGIEPKYLRMIHSRRHTEAELLIAEGVKGGRPGLKIGPPLVIYEKEGLYTHELIQMCE